MFWIAWFHAWMLLSTGSYLSVRTRRIRILPSGPFWKHQPPVHVSVAACFCRGPAHEAKTEPKRPRHVHAQKSSLESISGRVTYGDARRDGWRLRLSASAPPATRKPAYTNNNDIRSIIDSGYNVMTILNAIMPPYYQYAIVLSLPLEWTRTQRQCVKV